MANQHSHILISFCNVVAGAPVLGLLNIATSDVQVLRVPDRASALGGIAGLALSEQYVYAVTQRSNPVGRASRQSPGTSCLLIFDRDHLRLQAEHVLSSVVDAHSICLAGDELYVVSTGTDEVVRLRLRGTDVIAEEAFWRPDPEGPHADAHHLNAICLLDGDLLVSGFGRKSGPQWSSAKDGFILNIRTGEAVASRIYHPHSLLRVDGELVYCESSTKMVRVVGSARETKVPGYARGLCEVGGALFVGTSKGRRVSKSSGRLTNRGDPGEVAGRCAVARLSRRSFEVERIVDLDRFGWEVYDLVPVSDVDRWPVLSDMEWRDSAIRGLREGFEERDATISWLHVEIANRDDAVAALRTDLNALHERAAGLHQASIQLHREIAERDEAVQALRGELADLHTRFAEQHQEVERLHAEIAERDRTIEWLHREVAKRDRSIKRLTDEMSKQGHTIEWLHREVEDRHKQVEWLHGEVAKRDQSIEWLHREVAARDARIARHESQAPETGAGGSEPAVSPP